MVGLKRRSRAEGWALDVTDGDESINSSFLQRVGDNNKLWVGTFIVLVLVAGILIHITKQRSSLKNEDLYKSPTTKLKSGSYYDKDHTDFARSFVNDSTRPGELLNARYTDTGKFIITVPGHASADDIEYMASMAAQKNLSRFGNRVTVNVYQRSANSKSDVLVATAKWNIDRYGFVVYFIDRNK